MLVVKVSIHAHKQTRTAHTYLCTRDKPLRTGQRPPSDQPNAQTNRTRITTLPRACERSSPSVQPVGAILPSLVHIPEASRAIGAEEACRRRCGGGGAAVGRPSECEEEDIVVPPAITNMEPFWDPNGHGAPHAVKYER